MSKKLSKSEKTESDFFISVARLVFTKLRQEFVKALIFYHFNQKCHIQIKIDALSYAICGILSQLILDNLSQWHLVTFFF